MDGRSASAGRRAGGDPTWPGIAGSLIRAASAAEDLAVGGGAIAPLIIAAPAPMPSGADRLARERGRVSRFALVAIVISRQ
jgi:hypothetical protein